MSDSNIKVRSFTKVLCVVKIVSVVMVVVGDRKVGAVGGILPILCTFPMIETRGSPVNQKDFVKQSQRNFVKVRSIKTQDCSVFQSRKKEKRKS